LSKLPKSIRNVNACWNCEHCFDWYHDDDRYFCCNLTADRPLFFDYANSEELESELLAIRALESDEKRREAERAWDNWYDTYQVSPWKICDNYKQKE